MKKFLKIFGGIVLALLLLIGAGLIYFVASFPKAEPAANIKIELTSERVKRGEYLANHVTPCFYCHATSDYNYYSGPPAPGTKGKGGTKIEDEGLGVLYIPNITPAALGNWSDGEIVRAITAGVNKNGEALFPMMPYTEFKLLPEEDVHAIVAYLRTLPPIPNEVPKTQLAFPLNLIVRALPEPYQPKPRPAPSDTVAYGKYLTTVASCHFCHTQMDDRKQPLPEMDFAGGNDLQLPTGNIVRSANITPDENTGIGAWDKAYFIGRFKEYADSTNSHIPVAKDSENTVMPWTMYAGMTEGDLGAIYSYLRTVKPVKNAVEKHPKPDKSD
jgi:mono/diheme cytochrome c family protein